MFCFSTIFFIVIAFIGEVNTARGGVFAFGFTEIDLVKFMVLATGKIKNSEYYLALTANLLSIHSNVD